MRPDWAQADPEAIAAALSRGLAKPSGGWFVVGASRSFSPGRLAARGRDRRSGPWRADVDDRELVLWRTDADGPLLAAPAACPHLGADLATGTVLDGCLQCPWHGLRLSARGHGPWHTLPVHDDGVLTWVQLQPDHHQASPAPFVPERPAVHLDGVIRREATCEPRDVIANRLDPWHGVHFHPYAFKRLVVVDQTEEHIDLRVAYKVAGPFEVEVTARFAVPEPRTIVMTIIEGEGTGSVVETHATPIISARSDRAPRTAVIEATLATSDRPGFQHATRGAAVARPLIRMAANRLWADDARYAERLWHLRSSGWSPGD